MKFFTLTADADYIIGKAPRNTQVSIVHNGDFATGTLTFATRDPKGQTIQLLADPAPVTADGNLTMFLGAGQQLVFRVSGSITSIAVGIAGDYFLYDDSMQPFR